LFVRERAQRVSNIAWEVLCMPTADDCTEEIRKIIKDNFDPAVTSAGAVVGEIRWVRVLESLGKSAED
jgi:hypothetical protein